MFKKFSEDQNPQQSSQKDNKQEQPVKQDLKDPVLQKSQSTTSVVVQRWNNYIQQIADYQIQIDNLDKQANQLHEQSKKIFDAMKQASSLSNLNLSALQNGNLEQLANNIEIDTLFDPGDLQKQFSDALNDWKEAFDLKQRSLDGYHNIQQLANKTVEDFGIDKNIAKNMQKCTNAEANDSQITPEKTGTDTKAKVNSLFSGKIDPVTLGFCSYEKQNLDFQIKIKEKELTSWKIEPEISYLKDARRMQMADLYMQLMKVSLDYADMKQEAESGESGSEYTGITNPTYVYGMNKLLLDASTICANLAKVIQPVMFEGEQKGVKQAELIKEAFIKGSKNFKFKANLLFKQNLSSLFYGQTLPGNK